MARTNRFRKGGGSSSSSEESDEESSSDIPFSLPDRLTSDDSDSGDSSSAGNSSDTVTPTRGSGSGGSSSSTSSPRRLTTTGVDRTSRSTSSPDSSSEESTESSSVESDPGSSGGSTQPQDTGQATTARDSSEMGSGQEVIAQGSPREIAEAAVDSNLESGIEREGVGPAVLQDDARAAAEQFVENNEGARTVDDVAVRFDRKKDALVTTYSRSRSLDLVESEVEEATDPDKIVDRDPKRMFAGTERVPVGVDVDRDDLDVQLVETEDGGQAVKTSFNDRTQREIAKQKAASSSPDFGPNDFEVEDTGGGFVARPSGPAAEENLREDFAEQHGTDPEDVEIVREDGEIVGARGEVKTEGQQRESQLLPSIDVDVSERSIDFESGDLSAVPEPTPSRVFGQLAGFDEERIASMEEEAEKIEAKTQGGTPVGVGGGRTLPLRGLAAGAGAIGLGAAASQQTGSTQAADTSTSEVGIGSGISETEVGLGDFTSTSEVDVGASSVTVTEVEPTDTGASTTTVEPGEFGQATTVDLPAAEPVESPEGEVDGDSLVPGEYPLPGRDFPLDPTQEQRGGTSASDLIDPTATAAPAFGEGTAREKRRQEEDGEPLSELMEEFRQAQKRRRRERARAREEQLFSSSQIRKQEEERRRRARELPLVNSGDSGFSSLRDFSTGASAVLGREIGRVETAGRSNVLEETDSLTDGVVESSVEADLDAVAGAVDTDTATDTALDTANDVAAMTDALTPSVVDTATDFAPAVDTALETAPEMANEFVNETTTANEYGYGVGTGVGTSTLQGKPPLPDLDSGDRRRGGSRGFFERDIIAPVEENPIEAIDEDLDGFDGLDPF